MLRQRLQVPHPPLWDKIEPKHRDYVVLMCERARLRSVWGFVGHQSVNNPNNCILE